MLFRLSEPVKDRVRTITADCGKEVTGYATVTWALALECHLARPPVGAPAERIREGIGATVLIEVEEIQSSASRGGAVVQELVNDRQRRALAHCGPTEALQAG